MEVEISPITNSIRTKKTNLSFSGGYPICAISNERKILRFDSITTAAEKIGTARATIYNALCPKNPHKTAGCFAFAKVDKIFDENGKPNLKAAKKLAEAIPSLCVINKDLSIYTTLDRKDALNLTGLSTHSLSSHLDKNLLTPKGHIVVSRVNIEDENGNLVPEKAQELMNKALERKANQQAKVGFYVVTPDNKVELCKSGIEFAKKIGKTKAAVYACVLGQIKKVSGYTLIPRNKVENAKGEIDHKKLKKELKIRFSTPCAANVRHGGKVVGINRKGKVKVFENIEEAAKSTKRGAPNIVHILRGHQDCTTSGWTFVYANSLRDEMGNIPKSKVKEHFEKIFGKARTKYALGNIKGKKIIGIHSSGQIKILSSMKEAEKVANRKSTTVLNVINGKKRTTSDGWHFATEDSFKNKDGKISKEKIQERYKSVFKDTNKQGKI